MIEREIKFIVPGNMLSQYKNILDKLAVPERTLQINYYFDSPEFQLNSLRNTLRIRQKIKHLVLQYKYEKKCVGAERICQEFETEIRTFPLYISSKTFPNEINNPSPFYNYVGNLITERLEYLYNDTTIFLDKSYYLGKYDCEVEIEYQKYNKAEAILSLLSLDEIETVEKGKYSRFVTEFQRLGSNNDGH